MITQILSCYLLFGTQGNVPSTSVGPVAMGRTTTHLHSFFDARSMGPGDFVWAYTDPQAPGLDLTALAVVPVVSAKPVVRTVPLPSAARALYPVLPAITPEVPRTIVKSASVSRPPSKSKVATDTAKVKSDPAVATSSASTATSTPPAKKPVVPEKPKDIDEILVSLDCQKAPLHNVIGYLTEQTHANLLLLADDTATLTVRFTNRRLIDAIRDICAITDLSLLKIGDEYVIAKDEKLKTAYPEAYALVHVAPPKPAQEPITADQEVITSSYRTNYMDANKLVDALNKVYKPEQIMILAGPGGGSPGLTSNDTSGTSGASGSVIAKDAEADKVSRIVILRGPRAMVDGVITVLKTMDYAPASVNIAVTIVDISNDNLKNLGMTWLMPQITVQETPPANGIGFGSFSRTGFNFQTQLNALLTNDKAKLLASPNISVMDGQQAYVLVGQRLNFPVVVSYSQSGSPVFTAQQERVGIYLQASVWITGKNTVKMNLYPQVSTVSGFTNINGGSYPQISTREAQSTVEVESGKTIVLGGLINDSDIVNIQKVPILSSIPIFGEFFTNRNHTHNRDEVIISITPTITYPSAPKQ
jgi:type II secretory pathway component GspD/PulD (secretin)